MLIYVITDRRLRPDLDPASLVDEVAGSGADMMQIREKDLPAVDLLRLASRTALAGSSAPDVFVNGRVDVALAAGAAGVHLPASGLPAGEVSAFWSERLRIGVSVHHVEEARDAESSGASFVAFGPVFDTPSKRRYGPPVGIAALEEVAAAVRIPVFAIGGINRSNIGQLRDVGIGGAAVISAVLLERDMAKAVGDLRAAVGARPLPRAAGRASGSRR